MKTRTRISIVEDTDHIRNILTQRINDTDDLWVITTYANAEEAIIGLPSSYPDVVIMDIGLPGMSGIECMHRVKKLCPEMSFLMFTVFDNDAHVFDALKAGAGGYIMKEEKPSGVIRSIREFVSGGGPMSSEIAKKVMESFHPTHRKKKELEELTEHQKSILAYIASGLLNKEIASKLGITEGSMKVQISRIYKKLHVNNRVEAVNRFMRE